MVAFQPHPGLSSPGLHSSLGLTSPEQALPIVDSSVNARSLARTLNDDSPGSEGQGNTPADSGGASRGRVSIWDISTLDDRTGSRLNGQQGKTNSPSLWEHPGAPEEGSSTLGLSDVSVFGLTPAAVAILGVLWERPAMDRAEDADPQSCGLGRKDRPQP